MDKDKKMLGGEEKDQGKEKKVLSEEELSSVNGAGVPAMMNIRDQENENKDDPWKHN